MAKRLFLILGILWALTACEFEKLEPAPPTPAESDGRANEPPLDELVRVEHADPDGDPVVVIRFADPDGAQDLKWGQMILHDRLEGAAACFIHWEHAAGTLYLRNDAADALLGPTVPGKPGTVENSQCRIDASAVVATIAGDGITLEIPFRPTAKFGPPKNIYLRVADWHGHMTPWAERGIWPES